MKIIYLTIQIIITVLLYFILYLISIHTINHFTPEDFIYNIEINDVVEKIEILEIIETILTIILIILLYFISFTFHNVKKYRPQLIIISNIILLIVLIVYYLYWNTSFFYEWFENTDTLYYGLSDDSYFYLKLFTFFSILTSIVFNLHFLSGLISNKKKFKYIYFIFIPILSIIFLKYHSFFKSKVLIWVKYDNNENNYTKTEFLNLPINENALIWYKGIENWITYKEFLNNTKLKFIK
jgi:hypothetical protein